MEWRPRPLSPAIKHAAIVSIVRYKLYDTIALQHRSLGLLKVDSTLPLLETGGDKYNSSGNWPQIFIPFPGIHWVIAPFLLQTMRWRLDNLLPDTTYECLVQVNINIFNAKYFSGYVKYIFVCRPVTSTAGARRAGCSRSKPCYTPSKVSRVLLEIELCKDKCWNVSHTPLGCLNPLLVSFQPNNFICI